MLSKIKRLYKRGYSLRRLGEIFNVHHTTILHRMKKYKVKRRDRSETQTGSFGKKARRWKGGRILNSRGYYILYAPRHPHARGKYVLEHRLVMEKKLGRYLKPFEAVHHKNEVKTDNRIVNLRLFKSHGAHRAFHMKGNQYGVKK